MKYYIIGFGMLLVGCAPSEPIYRLDVNFTPDERAAVLEAGEIINQSVKPEYKIRWGEDNWYIRRLNPPGKVGGTTNYVKGEIDVQPESDFYAPEFFPADLQAYIRISYFRVVAMHELLHSLGLKHTATGVMKKEVETLDAKLTDADLIECRRVGVCN